VTASADRTLRVWDTASGTCLKVVEAHAAAVLGVAFNAQGQVLASSSDDGEVKLWQFPDFECLST